MPAALTVRSLACALFVLGASGCAAHAGAPPIAAAVDRPAQALAQRTLPPPGEEGVVYRFGGGNMGGTPMGGLTGDKVGTLWGTTADGGNGYGTVFVVQPVAPWYAERILYQFRGGTDGIAPYGTVIPGPDGTLLGTTTAGGDSNLGTVFELTPTLSSRPSQPQYAESVVYSFKGGADGANPYAQLAIDKAGALYGSTVAGGASNLGTIFKLTPGSDGYTESVLHSFGGMAKRDGASPTSPLYVERITGALIGVTPAGGRYGAGTVFKVTPEGSSYHERVLYHFQGRGDGDVPIGAPLPGKNGVFFGVTERGGNGGCVGDTIHLGCGTVYQITPLRGRYTKRILYNFNGGSDGASPQSLGTFEGDGIFGITKYGGSINSCQEAGCGIVFRLIPNGSSGYNEAVLWGFHGGSDGANPTGSILINSSATTYGTTVTGGDACNCGMVFLVIPFS